MEKKSVLAVLCAGVLLFSGCGYTTSSFVSIGQNRIFVQPFKNEIKITQEVTDSRMFRGYRSGMEMNITRSIIDKFLLDGNFKVGTENDCDVFLEGALVDFRKEALRYDSSDNIIEYRLNVVINFKVTNMVKNEVIINEKNFTGETTYRTTGTYAKSDDAGIRDAITDLANRVVEKVVEGW